MAVRDSYKYFFIVCGVILLDQATKFAAYAGKLRSFLNLSKPVFSQIISPNYNFAFSIALPHLFAYIVYAFVLLAFVLWFSFGTKNRIERFGFYLVIGGAISNIIDRICFGYVRDFIAGFWGNVFNLADIAIVAGIILILIANFRKS